MKLIREAKPMVDKEKYVWYEDDLKPVHFGPYTIVGHSRDPDGTHHLVIHDDEENLEIYLTGQEGN